MTMIPLDLSDLALAALLILLNAGLSIWLRLRLARQILVAALRMGIQLWLLGLVLAYLFEQTSPALTGAAALVMIGFAGLEVFNRQSRPIRGPWTYGLGTGSMLLAAGLVTVFALTALVEPAPWYDPRFALHLQNICHLESPKRFEAFNRALCLHLQHKTFFQHRICLRVHL